jgi:AraC-like DNA-binding protein
LSEPSISLFAVLLAVGLAQAFFLLLSLLTTGQDRRYANYALALLMGLFSYELLNQFLHESDFIAHFPQLSPFSLTTDLLYGPVIYLYVSRITQQAPVTRLAKYAVHFIPAGISLPVNLYHAVTSPRHELINYAREVEHNLVLLDISDTLFIFLGMVSMFAYLIASLRKLRRHRRLIGENFSYREAVDLAWLKSILIVIWILYLLYFTSFVLSLLNIALSESVYNLLFISIVCSIFWMGYRGIRQPHVFAQPVVGASGQAGNQTQAQHEVDDESGERYQGSGINQAESQLIFDELQAFLKDHPLYLEPKLTLAQVSEHTGFKSHYLSQAINQNREINFYDFINQYRVEFARQRLSTRKPGNINVLAIAMESGFNSKSSFYTAFKKHTGLTPHQYRNSQLKTNLA